MTCVCGHEGAIHQLTASGKYIVCWAHGCDCQSFAPSPLGGSGSALPDRAAPIARSTPAETTAAKSSASSVATDESPARSLTACAAGSSLTHRNVIDAVGREVRREFDVCLVERPEFEDSARLGWLAAAVARFLNNHPEHRAELLPEFDPETTETTW